MKIIIYSPPGCCQQCRATKTALERRGLSWDDRLASDYPEEVDRLAVLHGRQAPLVVAGEQSWSGFRPDLIGKL